MKVKNYEENSVFYNFIYYFMYNWSQNMETYKFSIIWI